MVTNRNWDQMYNYIRSGFAVPLIPSLEYSTDLHSCFLNNLSINQFSDCIPTSSSYRSCFVSLVTLEACMKQKHQIQESEKPAGVLVSSSHVYKLHVCICMHVYVSCIYIFMYIHLCQVMKLVGILTDCLLKLWMTQIYCFCCNLIRNVW